MNFDAAPKPNKVPKYVNERKYSVLPGEKETEGKIKQANERIQDEKVNNVAHNFLQKLEESRAAKKLRKRENPQEQKRAQG